MLKKTKQEPTSIANISQAIYLRPLRLRVIGLSLVALFLSTNLVSGFASDGNAGDSLAYDTQEELIAFDPAVSAASQGFLMKPNLQTADGERTGVNDVLKYTVKSGDTISHIAARFNISTNTVLATNHLTAKNTLKQGQELVIIPVDGLLYTVQKDDNLDKISKKYNIDKNNIIAQNGLKETSLAVGNQIILPGAKPVEVAPTLIAKADAKGLSKKPSARTASIFLSPGALPSDDLSGTEAAVEGAPSSCSGFAWPVAGGGRISQRYSGRHPAADITYGSDGQYPDILAAASGTVIQAEQDGWNGGYGHVIVIDHGNGFKTRYGHNSQVYVSVGDHVTKGQPIAKMGNTGRVYGKTGIHSHFEVINNGKRMNPLLCY